MCLWHEGEGVLGMLSQNMKFYCADYFKLKAPGASSCEQRFSLNFSYFLIQDTPEKNSIHPGSPPQEIHHCGRLTYITEKQTRS